MSQITPHTQFFDDEDRGNSKEAYLYSIKLLTKQDYSIHKLKSKLIKKSFTEDIVDSVIDKLIKLKYLREDLYAQARIKASMQKGYSIDYIQRKLLSENVSVEHSFIEDVFNEYNYSHETQIEYLLLKKLRAKDPKDLVDFNFRKKLIRYLMSKGHSLEQSSEAIESHMRSNDDRSQFV